jgi:hypothetical protein
VCCDSRPSNRFNPDFALDFWHFSESFEVAESIT